VRLYPRSDDASGVDHAGVHYKPASDGGFDLPDEIADLLHGSAVGGQPQWETSVERQNRQVAEELARQRSPEALYEAVSKLVNAATAAPAAKPEPVKPAPAKASATK
jgi:hypothetical protein